MTQQIIKHIKISKPLERPLKNNSNTVARKPAVEKLYPSV